MSRTMVVATGILAVLAWACAAPATQYTMTDLGTLGGSNTWATGINNVGQIVGQSGEQAFLYSGGVMTDLGTLGGSFSYATGINDAGQVVGLSDIVGNVDRHAFLYGGGVMTDLGTLGGSLSHATGIDNAGQVVGQARTNISTDHAFLYSGGVMQDLGTLGGAHSSAFGINNAGQVVGVAWLASGAQHAFLYGGGVMQDLGTLGWDSYALGVNNVGQVVGYSHTTVEGTPQHAFLYSFGVMQDLGTLGGSYGSAYSINNAGQIVGESHIAGNMAQHAFLYSGGVMTDLNSLIPANSGLTLAGARSINDRGQIAGYAYEPSGQAHAILLTPASPPQTVLLDWGHDVPFGLVPLQSRFTGVVRWVTSGSASLPAATDIPQDYRQRVLEQVSQIFADSGIENVLVTDVPCADAAVSVCFTRTQVGNFLGNTAWGPDRFNQRQHDVVAVFGAGHFEGLDAETVAHEVGHAFGLRHVDPDVTKDPLDQEVMDPAYSATPRFVNAVSPITDSSAQLLHLTHNPVYHLKRYVDGMTQDILEAQGIHPGTWDLDTGALSQIEAKINVISGFGTLYDFYVLSGSAEEGWRVLAHFDEVSSAELASLTFVVDQETSLQVVGTTTPGGILDTVLATGDPYDTNNLFFMPVDGQVPAYFQKYSENDSGYMTIGEVAVTGTAVPEPTVLSLFLVGGAIIVFRRCVRGNAPLAHTRALARRYAMILRYLPTSHLGSGHSGPEGLSYQHASLRTARMS